MTLGLYKPGQGYWVRVLSAALAGVLVLAACAWLWSQVLLIPIPTPTWVLQVSGASGTAAPGQSVALLADLDNQPGMEQIGTAEVIAVEPGTRGSMTLRVGRLAMNTGVSPGQAQAVGPGTGASAASVAGLTLGRTPVPVVQPMVLQAGAASVMLLIGAAVIYWIVGVNPRASEFLIATDGEMKKVNWSTRKGVIDSTWVVILWSVVLAAGLFVVDAAFSTVFKLIGVLE